jgi:3-deoxy-D-manno-octulosonic-acid transferase
MYLLYSFLLTLAFLALLPYFVWQAVTKRKYLNNFSERLGQLPASWRAAARPALWLHAVSVGETLAAVPLLQALRERFPQHRLIVSTTTATGQQVARERVAAADGVCYFPFDWRFAARRALRTIRPQAVILMESELWPNFLAECQARRIPVMVANGRISDRSFKRSQHVRWLLKPLYGKVTRFLMQSPADAERAVALGADAARVSVSGNLKYDLGATGLSDRQRAAAQELNDLFALDSTPLIVAGSTTALAGVDEEALLLKAFAALRQRAGFERLRLLIAPRHPERFAAVAELLASTSWQCVRRSTAHEAAPAASTADVILLDSIGELAALYPFAELVFVGGSLIPKGGHNILEPALYGKPIVVGPYMENFREITTEFLRREAVLQLKQADADELPGALIETFARLLEDKALAQRLGQNAQTAVAANRGATARTVEALAELLS